MTPRPPVRRLSRTRVDNATSLFGPHSLSFVNSKSSPQFTKASLPSGPYNVEAATGDTFTFRAFCRAGGAQSTAVGGRVLVSSNLPENGWSGAKHSGSNDGWTDCTSSAWTELSGKHTVRQAAGVRVGFRIDNKGGTIIFDGLELLRNPGADEQLSEEECRTAAALHGWAISVVNSSDRPKGCHYGFTVLAGEDIPSPAFFYNAYPYTGMVFSSTRRTEATT